MTRFLTGLLTLSALSSPSSAAVTQAAMLTWSSNGPVNGMVCTQVHESRERPDTGWKNNFVCASEDIGLRYASNGPIAGMQCTQLHESREPSDTTWDDNYLCLPQNSDYTLSWSSNGAIAGKTCTLFNEPRDPHTWYDNYLCME